MDWNPSGNISPTPGPTQKQNKEKRDAGCRGGVPQGWEGEPWWLCAFLAPSAQVKPLPSCSLTLPTLFRNRVPETGRAAGREARSVLVSFPFESPCGISFHTVRKSEREPVGWALPRAPPPLAAGDRQLPGAGWAGLGRGQGRAPTLAIWG